MQIAAIACDPVDMDLQWIKDIEEVGDTTMNFPIFSDTDRSVCEQFGMLMVRIHVLCCVALCFVLSSVVVQSIINGVPSTCTNEWM